MNSYQSLIEKAVTTVTVDFTEMKMYKDGKWRFIPPLSIVLVPPDYAGIVDVTNLLWWYLGQDKKAKLTLQPPIPEGHETKEHYLFQLHHGVDYSHHNEPLESSMLIERESLDKLATLKPEDLKLPLHSHNKGLYSVFNQLIKHVYPKIIKLDPTNISWHDEKILTKVETV